MKNNQFNNKDNNYNNTNNFSHIRSNYINPNTQKVNNNLFQNQQSFNINNTNNSVAFNSPLSTNINFNNISQRQFDNSSNFSKPYEDFSKTLSSQTVDTSINHRDSKAVKIKKITKKPISKPISSIFNPTTNYNTNNNINRNIDNNNLRNKENKVNMKRNNNQNIVNKKPVIQSNIKNNNNNNNNNNYKKKIIINKEKLTKNLDNNIIFNSLIDIDTFSNNNSKIKEYIGENNNDELIKCNINNIEEINNKDDFNLLSSINESAKKGENLNNVNNVFDVGSISNISKNGSGSTKEKNIDEEIKNNNKGFDKIIKDLIEEENCKSLFHDKNKNEIIKESIENNIIMKNNVKKEENVKKNIEIKEKINEKVKKDKEHKMNYEEIKGVITNFIEDIFSGLNNNDDNNKRIESKSNKESEKSKESYSSKSSYSSKKSKSSYSNNKRKESYSSKNSKSSYSSYSSSKKKISLEKNKIKGSKNEIEKIVSNFIDDIINNEEKELKKIVSNFIGDIINDEEDQMKNIVSNFIDNIITNEENEMKKIVSNFIDNIIIDEENKLKDIVSNFVDEIIINEEKENKNMTSNFTDDLINDAGNEINNMIGNFIDNIIKENENEYKEIVSNFIDNIINETKNDNKKINDKSDGEENIKNNDDEIDNQISSKSGDNTNLKLKKNLSRNKGNNNENESNEKSNSYSNKSNLSYESQSKSEEGNGSKKILKKNINKMNNLIQSVDISNNSNTLDNITSRKKNLFQSQEFPSTHIILTKYNLIPGFGKEINKNIDRQNSLKKLRSEHQQKRRSKTITKENLQIIYDNQLSNTSINSKNHQHIYIKAKVNKNKNRKTFPLNASSNINRMVKIKPKLENIILRESKKKYNFRGSMKIYFKKWKYLLNKNDNKDEKIIINNVIYNACQNKDNEMIYKLPNKIISEQKEHFGYYDSNIKICFPINIKISKGIFHLNNNREDNYQYFKDENYEKDEDMEIFVVKKVKNRRYSFQKNDDYTFSGTL